MTTGFNELDIGDHIEFKGPLGSFVWTGNGTCQWRGIERKVRKLGMLCGGSGITPILQVARGVIWDKGDTETEIWIIDANKSLEDIREFMALQYCHTRNLFQCTENILISCSLSRRIG